MITLEEILTSLRKGENIDTIAKDFTQTLNDAKAIYDREVAEAAAAEDHKVSVLTGILLDLQDFFIEYYPEYFKPEEQLSKSEWEEVCKELLSEMSTVMKIVDTLNIEMPTAASKDPAPASMEEKDKSIIDAMKDNHIHSPRGHRARCNLFDDAAADKLIKSFLKNFDV